MVPGSSGFKIESPANIFESADTLTYHDRPYLLVIKFTAHQPPSMERMATRVLQMSKFNRLSSPSSSGTIALLGCGAWCTLRECSACLFVRPEGYLRISTCPCLLVATSLTQ